MAVAMSAHTLAPLPLQTAPPSSKGKAARVPVAEVSPVSPLALFAAEMVSWLWFAPSASKSGAKETSRTTSEVARLQIQPTERFVRFCQEVLSTTQVSVSVVLLSLLLVSRLKQQNAIDGAPGSEYRLAVTGLMLANKILDDQTYTAQTWSQVSSLELKPLVAGEVEFLRGLDWTLHVSEEDYNAWLRLLQGHVASRNARLGKTTPPLAKSAVFATPSRRTAGSKRVRHSATRVHPCGLGLGLEQIPQPVPHPLSPDEDPFEGGRRTRRKLDLSTSTRTPLSLSPPFLSHVPASAPVGSTAASAPLPVYGHADRNHLSDPSLLSPSRLRSDARSSLSSSLGKRSAGEAFGRFSVGSSSASDLKGPSASVDYSAESMARSYSAGPISYPSVPVPGQTMYGAKAPPAWACAPPLQSVPFLFSVAGSAASSPLYSRPSSSSSSAHGGPAPAYFGGAVLPPHFAAVGAGAGFPTLVDSFSPRYDPEHYRQLQQGQLELGYYALAAGQGLGYYQTMHPVPIQTQPVWANPFAQYPAVPIHPAYSHSVSAASSPVLRASSSWQSPPYVLPQSRYHAVPPPPPPPPAAAYACSPLSTRPILPPLSNSHRRVSAETASSPIGSTTSTPQSLSAPPAPPSVHPSLLAPPPPLGASHLTPVRALQQSGYELPPAYGAHPVLPYGPMQPVQHWSAYSNAGIPGVYWRG
ncbi:hypothetical protein JCM8115_005606 [Rhodotorula mucilaginosa]|uniref:Cyclin n=1 Tax=Rhodotorula mucilaginosa TaxID=5537 RepID=A0A9P6W3R9_RHOMI|nr:hypothetical protein C6P46_002299 [Rhodotorula mucilaginosa]